MKHEIDSEKHRNNLLKTVEGTAWILCDAIHTMVENNVIPDEEQHPSTESLLAQRIAEIFEVVAECEEPAVIDHTADKMLEFAGNHRDQLVSYLGKYMGDNPLYKRIVENSKLH